MDKKIPQKQLDEILDSMIGTSHGKAMAQYLSNMVDSLDSVDGITKIEEALGRQYAKTKMKVAISRITEEKENKNEFNQYE